jgi:hypothetical protein
MAYTSQNPPPPPLLYKHYTHTTITATIHCIPPLYLFISSHSSKHNTYYVAQEPKTTYNITFTNNYTTRRTTKTKPPTNAQFSLTVLNTIAAIHNLCTPEDGHIDA